MAAAEDLQFHHRPISHAPSAHHFAGAWRSFPFEEAAMSDERHVADAPLSLQIPYAHQDLPTLSSAYTARSADVHHPNATGGHSARTPNTTSLPSFASLQEHANRSDETDEVEIAPMAARLSCYLCTQLKPLVREVAVAVAELDEGVQNYCKGSVPRTLDFPQDSPTRTVQWILDRLKYAKGDLQDFTRAGQAGGYYYPLNATSFPDVPPRTSSPSNPLKRPTDQWDHYDGVTSKHPRSGASPNHYSRRGSLSFAADDRRASIDFAAGDSMHRSRHSPPITESLPGSAYPRMGSPMLSGRAPRALPSPSSLAPANGHSVGSPALSYQPASSIHTVSTSSATSAHIADLQHQVTLKSLALQTLQSEYASLLQKLQRERVKSQTIEKKTSVADQEVNDLTSKNEDLSDQIKTLEMRLEESEGKRETERSEGSKEKEQWRRMLDMGNRLQAKHAEEMQKIRAEKAYLEERMAAYEIESAARYDTNDKDSNNDAQLPRLEPRRASGSSDKTVGQESSSASESGRLARNGGDGFPDLTSLIRENTFLTSRVDVLRAALQGARRHYQDWDEHARASLTTIDTALNEVSALSSSHSRHEEAPLIRPDRFSNPVPRQSAGTVPIAPASDEQISLERTQSLSSAPTKTAGQSQPATVAISKAVRAHSPSPAELGFHVVPSTASPEELIQALGPIPGTVPAMRYGGTASQPSASGTISNAVYSTRHSPLHEDNAKRAHGISWLSKSGDRREPRPLDSSLVPTTGYSRAATGLTMKGPFTVASPIQSFHSSPGSVSDHTSPASSASQPSNPDTPAGAKYEANFAQNETSPSLDTTAKMSMNMLPHQGWRRHRQTPSAFEQPPIMAPPPRPFQA